MADRYLTQSRRAAPRYLPARSTGVGAQGVGQMFSSFFGNSRRGAAPRFSYNLSSPLASSAQSGFLSQSAPRFDYGYKPMDYIAPFLTAQQGGASMGQKADAFLGGQWSGAVGKVGRDPTFGQFAKTPAVYDEVEAAAAKYGVPANFLMAILAKESSGNWANNSTVLYARGMPIHGFVGVFQNAAESWGFDFWKGVGNRAYQIETLAGGLRQWYDRLKKQNPSYDWLNVAAVHYSGDPSGASTPGDSWQHGSTAKYMQDVKDWWARLDAYAGQNTQGFNPGSGGLGQGANMLTGGGAGGGLPMVWGGQSVSEKNLDYGWNAPSGLGLYTYGNQYGMNGVNHTGIDIGGNVGDPLYTPVSGRVVCACTGVGNECGAFNDYFGGGCGRVEIETANGDRIIFGHSSTSTVRLGDVVQAGQQVATMGGMNGPHVHLEYRTRDPSMPSGWRIVDPAQYLGGAGGQVFGAGAMGQMGGAPQPVNRGVSAFIRPNLLY